MFNPLDYELLILVLSFFCFWAMTWIGGYFRRRSQKLEGEDREEFLFILGGTLTLLGLIIGFTFSMAVSRYDLRKQYEEQEANTIGTEYSRVDLLPAADATKVHQLLRSYLDQRILHYETGSNRELEQIDAQTERLQWDLWSGVAAPAAVQPTPVNTLILAGMNEAIDSQGYAQAASWNRIPIAAWGLLTIVSMFCNFLVGYSLPGKRAFLSLILPIALSVSFVLIADIDSPRTGLIHVRPHNLTNLADSLRRAEGRKLRQSSSIGSFILNSRETGLSVSGNLANPTFRDLSGLGHLVVLPVACSTRIDYTATSLLSEEPSRATANPQGFSDLFR